MKNRNAFNDIMPVMRVVPLDGDFGLMAQCSMNSANPAKRGLWVWPGGQIDLLPHNQGFAEESARALLREARDEANLRIRSLSAPQLIETRPITDGKHAGRISMTYASTTEDFEILNGRLDAEITKTGWFPLESIATMPNVTPVTRLIMQRLTELQQLPAIVYASPGLLQ